MAQKRRKSRIAKPIPLLVEEPEFYVSVYEEWQGRWRKPCRIIEKEERTLLCDFCDRRDKVWYVVTQAPEPRFE